MGLDFSRWQSSHFDGQRINSLDHVLEKQYGQFGFVINYLGSASNYLTRAMADNYVANGLQVVSVYEVTWREQNWDPKVVGNDVYIDNCLGYDNGVTDGINAYNNALNKVEQPADTAIYFAVDGNVSTNGGHMQHVTEYFCGIQDGMSQAATII